MLTSCKSYMLTCKILPSFFPLFLSQSKCQYKFFGASTYWGKVLLVETQGGMHSSRYEEICINPLPLDLTRRRVSRAWQCLKKKQRKKIQCTVVPYLVILVQLCGKFFGFPGSPNCLPWHHKHISEQLKLYNLAVTFHLIYIKRNVVFYL